MSRDKQIEEMAIELSKVNCKPKGCGYCYLEYGTLENSCEEYLFYKKMAIALYNAGYRKSQDVAEEIFAEIDKLLAVDKNGEANLDVRALQSLKKKYTGSEDTE